MNTEHRCEPREHVTLALHFAGGSAAVAHNVSPSGLYIETDSPQRIGGLIDFEIEFDSPGGPLKFKAQGKIMRLEAQDGRTGVGVKLLSSRLESVD